MPGLLHRKPHRRRHRALARMRHRFRPRLEELEARTVFAVGSAAFPAALAVSQLGPFPAAGATTTSQPAVFQGPSANPAPTGALTGTSPFTTQPGTFGAPFAAGLTAPGAAPATAGADATLSGGAGVLNGINPFALGQLGAASGGLNPSGGNLVVLVPPLTTNLGPASFSSGALVVVEPQAPTLSPATLAPENLPLSSPAPMNVLDPANYLLARGLNPSLHAGNLPSLLVTQTTETVLEAGANGGGGGNNPLNDAGPAPAREALPPDDQERMRQQIQEAIRFLASARPAAHDGDAAADYGPAAPEGATPLGEPLAAVASADVE